MTIQLTNSKHLLLLDASGGVVNIGGTVKPGVVLHCAEQYPHTASITTTANMVLAPEGAEQFKHYALTTMLYLDCDHYSTVKSAPRCLF